MDLDNSDSTISTQIEGYKIYDVFKIECYKKILRMKLEFMGKVATD